MKLLNEKQLANLKEELRIELMKRGFNADLGEVTETDKNKISFESEPFQTTPVIFKEIKLIPWSSNLKEETMEHGVIINVYISINVRYTHFDLGTNGCDVFTFSCSFFKGKNEDRLFKKVVK